MRADSTPMLEALRIYKEVQDRWGFYTMLQHVPSSNNTIADKLSRVAIQQALHEAYSGLRVQVVPPRVPAPGAGEKVVSQSSTGGASSIKACCRHWQLT